MVRLILPLTLEIGSELFERIKMRREYGGKSSRLVEATEDLRA